MNSRERFLAVLRGEKPDRTPLAHVAALTSICTVKNFFIRMEDSLRHRLITPIKQICEAAANPQIYLDSS